MYLSPGAQQSRGTTNPSWDIKSVLCKRVASTVSINVRKSRREPWRRHLLPKTYFPQTLSETIRGCLGLSRFWCFDCLQKDAKQCWDDTKICCTHCASRCHKVWLYSLSLTSTMRTVELCDITRMFGVFLRTNKLTNTSISREFGVLRTNVRFSEAATQLRRICNVMSITNQKKHLNLRKPLRNVALN